MEFIDEYIVPISDKENEAQKYDITLQKSHSGSETGSGFAPRI